MTRRSAGQPYHEDDIADESLFDDEDEPAPTHNNLSKSRLSEFKRGGPGVAVGLIAHRTKQAF